MKRRIGSAYDEIRNRQLAAIWDDEYVKPINRRAYGLEKEQYIKVYPDANTQLHKPELPQQLQYNFDIACDKFSSQLMHFVSLIENAFTRRSGINTLKWSDLFDSYSTFKLTIQYFLKLQNYKSSNIIASISKVIESFLRFSRAFTNYDNFYVQGYADRREINRTIVSKIIEMESYLQSIQLQFQVFNNPVISPLVGQPNTATAATAATAAGSDDDDEDDESEDEGSLVHSSDASLQSDDNIPGLMSDDDSDPDDNPPPTYSKSMSSTPFNTSAAMNSTFSQPQSDWFESALRPSDLDETSEPHSGARNQLFSSDDHSILAGDTSLVPTLVDDTQVLRTQNELTDADTSINDTIAAFTPPKYIEDIHLKDMKLRESDDPIDAINREFDKKQLNQTDRDNANDLIRSAFGLNYENPEDKEKYLDAYAFLLNQMALVKIRPSYTHESILRMAPTVYNIDADVVQQIIDEAEKLPIRDKEKKIAVINRIKHVFATQRLFDRAQRQSDFNSRSKQLQTPRLDRSQGLKSLIASASKMGINDDRIDDLVAIAKDDIYSDPSSSGQKMTKETRDARLAKRLEELINDDIISNTPKKQEKQTPHLDSSRGMKSLRESAQKIGLDDSKIIELEEKAKSNAKFILEDSKKTTPKKEYNKEESELIKNIFEDLVMKDFVHKSYEEELAEYDSQQFEKAPMIGDTNDLVENPLRLMSLHHDQEVIDADATSGGLPIDSLGLKTNVSSKAEKPPLDTILDYYNANANELRNLWNDKDFDNLFDYFAAYGIRNQKHVTELLKLLEDENPEPRKFYEAYTDDLAEKYPLVKAESKASKKVKAVRVSSQIPTKLKATGKATRVEVEEPIQVVKKDARLTEYNPTQPNAKQKIRSLQDLIMKDSTGNGNLATYREKYIQNFDRASWDRYYKAAGGK
jgi:hypothetical protein